MFKLIALFPLFLISCSAPKLEKNTFEHSKEIQPWNKMDAPTKKTPQVYGGYTHGCFDGGVSLKPTGVGYQMMRLSRKRFYGHPQLISFIESFGRKVHSKKMGSLLIGDIAQPRGGPGGTHMSHQSGLDVDIWYDLLQPKFGQLDLNEREILQSTEFVESNEFKLKKDLWKKNQTEILKIASLNKIVERILVNPAIKMELCKRYPKQKWLLKLRPWWGHGDHFHVRLKCPKNSPLCVSQKPITEEGTGCDHPDFLWWFSEEAKKKIKEKEEETPDYSKVILPEACKGVQAYDYWDQNNRK